VELVKNREDQLKRSCEKQSITESYGGEEHPANNKEMKAN
jgi:hypothetical protein